MILVYSEGDTLYSSYQDTDEKKMHLASNKDHNIPHPQQAQENAYKAEKTQEQEAVYLPPLHAMEAEVYEALRQL